MKLKISKNDLLAAIGSVIGAVERRQTQPILVNVLLDASDHDLRVVGTDLELELEARAAVVSATPGQATVSCRKLYDILRGLPEGSQRQTWFRTCSKC